MRDIKISDMTMCGCNGADDAFSLTFREKIEVAKCLDRLGVDVIEIEGITHPKIDSLRIKSIATAVKNSTLAVPVGFEEDGVSAVWDALKTAATPRLQVKAPVSSVQMEYLFHLKPQAIEALVAKTIAECCALTAQVEYVAEDATRADRAFLIQMINTAIDSGAKIITLSDAAGTMMADEFSDFISTLYKAIPKLAGVTLGICCANTLATADMCAMAGAIAGAGEIKTAAYPVNTVSLSNIARILEARGMDYDCGCHINTTILNRTVGQIGRMCETERKANSAFDQGVQDLDNNIQLTPHDSREAVLAVAEQLGYELSEEDANHVYEAFIGVANKKGNIGTGELDAIIATAALQVPPTYRIENYVINAGNAITATSHMKLSRKKSNGDVEILESVCLGDGPIDASFLAIEQIVGTHYELDDFQIRAVTRSREAMGEAVVKLRAEGKIYSGRGISTDIIQASIFAYINALNKIVFERE